jgi:hypothetical protein
MHIQGAGTSLGNKKIVFGSPGLNPRHKILFERMIEKQQSCDRRGGVALIKYELESKDYLAVY